MAIDWCHGCPDPLACHDAGACRRSVIPAPPAEPAPAPVEAAPETPVDLVDEITDENVHGETFSGPPVGAVLGADQHRDTLAGSAPSDVLSASPSADALADESPTTGEPLSQSAPKKKRKKRKAA